MKHIRDISVRAVASSVLFIFSFYAFIPFVFYLTGDISTSLILFSAIPFLLLPASLFIRHYITINLINPLALLRKDIHNLSNKDFCKSAFCSPDLNVVREMLSQWATQQQEASQRLNDSLISLDKGNLALLSRNETQSRAVEKTAYNVNELYQVASHNEQESNQAFSLASMTLAGVQEAIENVSLMTNSTTTIKDQSLEIKKISDFISEMAFKTNLLSLNASIEAARAGDHGRGFSVVANEVRLLAKSCADSAQEIKALVNDTSSQIEDTFKLNNKNAAYIREMLTMIERTNAALSAISISSKEQRMKIECMKDSIDNIIMAVYENTTYSEETAKTLNNIRHDLDDIEREHRKAA